MAFALLPLMAHAEFDHSNFDKLLRAHVRPIQQAQSSQVDYAALSRNRAALQAYLKSLEGVSRAQFDQSTKPEQLAFLINAYNAWTLELILTKYPNLESIKDLGTFLQSPWKKKFIPLLGETRSLDDIEHSLIRGSGRYEDARIHFAVNCASIGCPALRNEAFVSTRLDAQLNEATRLFLADRTRNRLENQKLNISMIFKWYRGDFEKGQSLAAWLARQAPALGLNAAQTADLQAGKIEIDFLDYDWRLNRTP